MLNDISLVRKYYDNFNYVRIDLNVQEFYIIIQYDGFNIKSFAFCDPILRIHSDLRLSASHIWAFCTNNGESAVCRESKMHLMDFVVTYINTHVKDYHDYARSNHGRIKNLNATYRMYDIDVHGDNQVINPLCRFV